MEERNLRFGEKWAVVDGIGLPLQRFGFGELVGLQTLVPGGRMAAARTLACGPAFEIEHRRVAVNGSDLGWVCGGPVVDKETTAAHPFEDGLGGKTPAGQERVEGVAMGDRGGAAEEAGHVEVGEVISLGHHGAVHLVMVPGKAGAPDPRVAGRRLVRNDQPSLASVDLEVKLRVPVPKRLSFLAISLQTQSSDLARGRSPREGWIGAWLFYRPLSFGAQGQLTCAGVGAQGKDGDERDLDVP